MNRDRNMQLFHLVLGTNVVFGCPRFATEQFGDSYKLLPIHKGESIPVDISPLHRDEDKRDSVSDKSEDVNDETLEKGESISSFAEEKYPSIFAKFKIDTKMEKEASRRAEKSLQKRESSKNPSLLSEKHANSLKSTLSKIVESNQAGAQAELKHILNVMGLIEDAPQINKRAADLTEDEDLEHGTNKINLIQIENYEERTKRSGKTDKKEKTDEQHYGMIEIPEPKPANEEEESIEQYANNKPEKEHNEEKNNIEKRADDAETKPAEKENKDKEKRSEDEELQSDDKEDAEKGLDEAELQTDEKQDRAQRSDEVAEQMEKQINERLQKIKEEVRNEIEQLKDNDNADAEDTEEGKGEKEEEIKSRRKRNVVSSLVDEETSDVDPVLFGESNLSPHIRRRRRRSLNEDLSFGQDRDDNRVTSSEEENKTNIAKKEQAINKIDVGDKRESKNVHNIVEAKSIQGEEDNLIVNSVSLGENSLAPLIRRKRSVVEDLTVDKDKDENTVLSRGREEQTRNTIDVGKKKETRNGSGNERDKEEEDKLIIDLNPDSASNGRNIEDAKDPIVDHSRTATPTIPQYAATTTDHFFLRSLKLYRAAEIENNYNDIEQDFQDDSESLQGNVVDNNREKKSCTCDGKACKCPKPKPIFGTDGSSIIYFDGAARIAGSSFDEAPVVKEKVEKASMQFLPQKRRSFRQNEGKDLARTKTDILRGLRDGGYMLDLNPDIYRITEQDQKGLEDRHKRSGGSGFADLVALHGGGPVMDHLIAIRERSMLPRIRVKRKADVDKQQLTQTDQPLTLNGMSDEDLFGALPQSYEGELARYKRV